MGPVSPSLAQYTSNPKGPQRSKPAVVSLIYPTRKIQWRFKPPSICLHWKLDYNLHGRRESCTANSSVLPWRSCLAQAYSPQSQPGSQRADPGDRAAGRPLSQLPLLFHVCGPGELWLHRAGILLRRHGQHLQRGSASAEQADSDHHQQRLFLPDAHDCPQTAICRWFQRHGGNGVAERHRRLRTQRALD